MVIFHDGAGGDKMTEKIFKGPIHYQLRNALTFIQNSIIKEHIRKVPYQAEAIRFFNYPYVALEEALVNAVYHRDHEIREPIEVRVNEDRIDILSFPGPDRSIKDEDLKSGNIIARRYRNRRIGEFLKELDMTEGRCTGIPKMINSMKNNGSPTPIFQTDEERSYFIATLPVHPEFLELEKEKQESPQESVQESMQVSVQVIRVLKFCKTAQSKHEILKHIGLSTHHKNYQKHILSLVKKGLLSMTHPENPKHRNQKYVITQSGFQTINQQNKLKEDKKGDKKNVLT